jgi:hypothetical protein
MDRRSQSKDGQGEAFHSELSVAVSKAVRELTRSDYSDEEKWWPGLSFINL